MGFEPPLTTRQHRGLTARPLNRRWVVGVGRERVLHWGGRIRKGGPPAGNRWGPHVSTFKSSPIARGRISLQPVERKKKGE